MNVRCTRHARWSKGLRPWKSHGMVVLSHCVYLVHAGPSSRRPSVKRDASYGCSTCVCSAHVHVWDQSLSVILRGDLRTREMMDGWPLEEGTHCDQVSSRVSAALGLSAHEQCLNSWCEASATERCTRAQYATKRRCQHTACPEMGAGTRTRLAHQHLSGFCWHIHRDCTHTQTAHTHTHTCTLVRTPVHIHTYIHTLSQTHVRLKTHLSHRRCASTDAAHFVCLIHRMY